MASEIYENSCAGCIVDLPLLEKNRMQATLTPIRKPVRTFVPDGFTISDWASLAPLYQQLMQMPVETAAQLETFLKADSELEAVVQEDMAWRYIRMTCNTQDKAITEAYQYFINEILPHLQAVGQELRLKVNASPAFGQLPDERFLTLKRTIRQAIELFREENIPLSSEAQQLSMEYDQEISTLAIEHEGQKLTIQRAAALLEEKDRSLRKQIWDRMVTARLEKKEVFHTIFDKLLDLRTRMARNAGYKDFAAFRFADLGRFDYTREDCFRFHDAIEKVVKPVYVEMLERKCAGLGLEALQPYDTSVDPDADHPLRPFQGQEALISGTIKIFSRLYPGTESYLQVMKDGGYFDLESRIGKAPGGYNYGLAECGIPFIFMNAVGTHGDLITMLHECGHALHTFSMNGIPLNSQKDIPSEVAELASMSMELMAQDYLDAFYTDPADIKRARRDQITRSITILPWIATIDAFQWWMYENPEHTHAERNNSFVRLYKRFHGDVINWQDYEEYLLHNWQRQGHIYGSPFYYIEYGIAQLGAIAVWKNYREHPEKGFSDYLAALQMGYTRPIPEIYQRAGIRFDFSEAYVNEIVGFAADAWRETL